jgi:hypothetical protein
MKTLLILLVLASSVHAIQLKDLIGNWSGQRRDVVNGVGVQYKVTVESSAKAGGVVMIIKGFSPVWGPIRARETFKKDGTFSETLTASGFILASGKGKWEIRDGKIHINATGGNLGGKVRVAGAISKIGKNQMKYSGKSNGANVSFNLKRL